MGDEYGAVYEPDAITGRGEAVVKLRKRTDYHGVK